MNHSVTIGAQKAEVRQGQSLIGNQAGHGRRVVALNEPPASLSVGALEVECAALTEQPSVVQLLEVSKFLLTVGATALITLVDAHQKTSFGFHPVIVRDIADLDICLNEQAQLLCVRV